MQEAIQNRRRIRKFQKTTLPRAVVEQILQAGTLAPSSKNRQPWQFIVAAGAEKEPVLAAMRDGIQRERDGVPLLPGSRRHLGGAENTLRIMEEAPVTVFVINPLGGELTGPQTFEERVYEICNIQSVGAALENMALAATALGVGSLWICDIFFAYPELAACLDVRGELAAAMAFGYPGESPEARPRKNVNDITEWRGI